MFEPIKQGDSVLYGCEQCEVIHVYNHERTALIAITPNKIKKVALMDIQKVVD